MEILEVRFITHKADSEQSWKLHASDIRAAVSTGNVHYLYLLYFVTQNPNIKIY